MKGKFPYYIVFTVIIALFYFSIRIIMEANEYKKMYSVIRANFNMLVYLYPFELVYPEKNEFPRSLSEIPSYSIDSSFNKNYFRDPLGDKNEKLIYFPLFDKLNNKFDSYMIVSRGIDGQLNNAFNSSDTVFKSEIFDKFNFYNELCWKDFENYSTCDSILNSKFNLIKYLFGKKDYLIFYLDFENNTLSPPISEMQDSLASGYSE